MKQSTYEIMLKNFNLRKHRMQCDSLMTFLLLQSDRKIIHFRSR